MSNVTITIYTDPGAIASARVPTSYGEFTGHAWRCRLDGMEHLALVKGDVGDGDPVLVPASGHRCSSISE